MKQTFELVVVIPVGPACKPEFIEDTVRSINYYVRSSCMVILADDSQKGTGARLQERLPDLDVFITPHAMGKLCGLYITLSLAFCYALDKYEFRALLRMDTDALLIGKSPEKDAFHLFDCAPSVGIAGQYPYSYNGDIWDRSWPGGQLYRIMHSLYFFTRPRAHAKLIARYLLARKHHYQRGESVFGGACFFNASCLKALRANGLLPSYAFKNLQLEEDHLFSLLAKSIGFELGSLSGPSQPFGCAWLGLPASPQALYEAGKKIIHSTRYWNNLKEEDIRAWFKEKRAGAGKGLSILNN